MYNDCKMITTRYVFLKPSENSEYEFGLKIIVKAQAGAAQSVGVSSYNRRVAGSIPSQGTYLGGRFDP